MSTGSLSSDFMLTFSVIIRKMRYLQSGFHLSAVCTKMQEGASLILDLSSRHVSATLRSMADGMGIAHVSAVDPSFEEPGHVYNTSVNFRPPSSAILTAIRDSVRQENLTNVGIFYDHTFGASPSLWLFSPPPPPTHTHTNLSHEFIECNHLQYIKKIHCSSIDNNTILCTAINFI